ncbi:MAG: citrulline utilization hydrolase CtlX [Ginsengibacter sp.]
MQSSKNILLIRPSTFAFNPETAASNAFQVDIHESEEEIKKKKLQEFEAFVKTLRSKGVNVFVADDTAFPAKPDAIFPNNWVSFHSDGTVILYPMYAPNRRHERRQEILDLLEKDFTITRILDLSKYENEGKYLEGTGSIIFDHINKLAYACLSPRTDKELLLVVCNYLKYQPIYFYAHDENGKEIYHTNVMMCIGEKFSIICLHSITDMAERELVNKSLTKTGHQIFDITFEQMKNFAGNMLEIQTNDDKSILALSQSAYNGLTINQKQEIEKYSELVPIYINTIETIGGGSARCMIAEIFLPEN